MEKLQRLRWSVGHTTDLSVFPEKMVPATVPGAAQLDYTRANGLPPYEFGTNYKDYGWMEDVYWVYQAPLSFTLTEEQSAHLVFKGIDYRYEIRLDSQVLAQGEGMFTPVELDVTAWAGDVHTVQVALWPAPKSKTPQDRPGTRDEARFSCKPAACYGWDWHPRLISVGLWDEAGLWIRHKKHIKTLDVSYALTPALDSCRIDVSTQLSQDCRTVTRLLDGDQVVAEGTGAVCSLTVTAPKLWYPVGYGQQSVYTLEMAVVDEAGTVLDVRTRKLGLRRVKIVMNEGSWKEPSRFPKSRSDAPATLEINGIRVFAKGSNWVNAHIFPGALRDGDYEALVKLVQDANMNILRIWGGGFVNHEAFFDLCDEMGIMVWQEFPLACNEYPDDDGYLAVLEQEAVSIIRRLRSHPCVVLWCGGNELFNSWSKMTEQHHALRLLDRVCYTEDRFTPFIMTSPLNGMAHGHYSNYDDNTKEEFIATVVRSNNTAYTEFGSPGAADPAYIQKYMTPEDYACCDASTEAWTAHHAFRAWTGETWLRKPEVDYYFGGYTDVDDLCKKTQFIQAMCYRSLFEEMRKQWPHCSMALNWCFNEPWPCFANNSLVCWPTEIKPAYYAVQQALRPQLASLRIDRHRWWAGTLFSAEAWILNDRLEGLSGLTVEISYRIGDDAPVSWGSLHIPHAAPQENVCCGSISFMLPASCNSKFSVRLKVVGHPEMDSEYTYLCRPKAASKTTGLLNM